MDLDGAVLPSGDDSCLDRICESDQRTGKVSPGLFRISRSYSDEREVGPSSCGQACLRHTCPERVDI